MPSASIEQRPWKEALLWLLLLAPGFLLAYTLANLHAAQLPADRIGDIGMDWERFIPFWPWTVVPYMSIELLYVISPFVCATRRELRVHVLRFAVACAVSIACFVAFPLRFAAVRPDVDGVPGLLFALLGLLDHPFNQAPSLHISLLVILWSCYRRHCPPRWRWLLHLGFASIATSVLTTWQHHFLDIPSGLAVGAAACWLLPVTPRRRDKPAAPPIVPTVAGSA
jgi:hypothetical protein